MRRAFRLRLGGGHVAREVDDELSFHIEMRTEKLVRQGMDPDVARREAMRMFGSTDEVRDDCVALDHERERAMRRANRLDEFRQDILYTLRTLKRNPGFAAVIVLMLAIGIGANTAIFTLIDATLLRRLPVANPDQLVTIGDPTRVGSMSFSTSVQTHLSTWSVYRDVVRENRSFSGVLASGRADNVTFREQGGRDPERLRARYVSGNYFDVLGVRAERGRTFESSADDAPGAAQQIVLSHDFWTRRFGADPSMIGRTLTINGVGVTVIGIAPQGFDGEIVGQTTEAWLPITMQPLLRPATPLLQDKGAYWLLLMGRLRPGVSVENARAEIVPLYKRIMATYFPESEEIRSSEPLDVQVASGARGFSRVRATYGPALMTLMVGVGLLLLVICGNVANLLLARSVARAKEISVRVAIGAGRGRLIRQLLTESSVLALISAAAGIGVAAAGSRLLLALVADGGTPIPLSTRMDLPILLFVAGLSVVAVLLFGLAPALRASRVDLAATLRAHAQSVRDSALGARGQRMPVGKVLVAANVALSLIMLIGAALVVRSLRSTQETDIGVDRDKLLLVEVDFLGNGYEKERLVAAIKDMRDRLARVQGVSRVSYSLNGIFSGTNSGTTLQVPGFTPHASEDTVTAYDAIGPGYARTVGARIIAGRDIENSDLAGSEPVGLINELGARFYFGSENPVGRYVRFDSTNVRIVGVVGNILDQSLTDTPERKFYRAWLQNEVSDPGNVKFIVRTEGDAARLVEPLRREVRNAYPAILNTSVDPLRQLVRNDVRQQRLLARIGSGFGALALLLAAIGLYGVMTYAINRRRGEIGLRLALGASRSEVVRMVLVDALRLVAAGVVIGFPLALLSTRYLRAQLHGVGPTDPAALSAALFVLAAFAFVAALLPALRAARVAPMVALRTD